MIFEISFLLCNGGGGINTNGRVKRKRKLPKKQSVLQTDGLKM